MTFPRRLEQAGRESLGNEKPGRHTKKYTSVRRLVLAEDDPDDSEFFVKALSSLPGDTMLTIAENGRDLMKVLRQAETLPDLVFLDLNMPIKNGHECVKEIRANPKLRELIVLVLSTSGDIETIDSLFKLGASGFIVKPVNFGEWAVLLSQALSRKWSRLPSSRDKFVLSAKS